MHSEDESWTITGVNGSMHSNQIDEHKQDGKQPFVVDCVLKWNGSVFMKVCWASVGGSFKTIRIV